MAGMEKSLNTPIIDFERYKFEKNTVANMASNTPVSENGSSNEISTGLSGEDAREVKYAANTNSGNADFITIERLYPIKTKIISNITEAAELLKKSLDIVDEASEFLENDDLINSDSSIQSLQAYMAELFCLRDLSEGLGQVAMSVFYAIQNMKGLALNSEQISNIRLVMYRSMQEPLMNFDRSIEIIEHCLEENGFNTDPSEAEHYSKILDA